MMIESLTKKKQYLIAFLFLVAGLSLGFYIYISIATYRLGFPLDDAWIHQTYARNIASLGQWSYVPGKVSAGSTAPLWSLILSIGYLLHVNPYIWTFSLGWFILTGLAYFGFQTYKVFSQQLSINNNKPVWGLGAGVLICLEWHLVWAAGSGMETLLFSLLVTSVIIWLIAKWDKWFYLGILIGLSVWLRPDGFTLLAPALLATIVCRPRTIELLKNTSFLFLGYCLLFIPYLSFNNLIAGNWWPNTFYAKQAEYAVLQNLPLWIRGLQQFGVIQIGVGILLLPGFFYLVSLAIRNKSFVMLVGFSWVLSCLGLYAWRLPVVYQHGRYVIPVMPLFFLWGYIGVTGWVEKNERHKWGKLINRVWLISLGIVLIAFWLQGAISFGRDVSIIESEMVDTAKWMEKNTDSTDLIAAHDIGALGYYGQRKIIDLAGLISPDVIPFIRDERRLAIYMNDQNIDYLVTFPNWYPSLIQCGMFVYKGEKEFSLVQGGENMAVYQWKPGCTP